MRRSAFTLLELLVVLSIMVVLTALILPAVQKARATAKRVQAKAEVDQFGMMLQAFAMDHDNTFPPVVGGGPNGEFRLCTSYSDVNGNLLDWPEVQFLMQAWPRMSRADNGLRNNGVIVPNTAPVLLDPNQAAMFWMTGGTFCNFNGLSKSPTQPFLPFVTGDSRKRYLDPPSRALYDASGVADGRFYDVYGNPLAVMTWSSKGYTAGCYGVQPYSLTYRGQLNLGSSQVISAGPDGKFGPGGVYTPGAGAWASGQPGADDLANFRPLPLGIVGSD